ncbi:MAG: tyrosine-type recombinase/integrase [Phascolarctobacterium sp.]|nr:tyrosine-type recombinase/integrase [Phascolarctobacterium sp.]
MARRARGEGTFVKVHDGKLWSFRIYVPVLGEQGIKKRKEFTARTKSEAKRKAEAYLEELEVLTKKTDNVKLSVWITRWLQSKPKDVNSIKTYEQYERNCRLYIIPKLGSRIIQEIKPIEIQEFFSELQMTPGIRGRQLSVASLNGIRRTLNAVIQSAVDNDIITKNVVRGTKPFRGDKVIKIALSVEQVKKLLLVMSSKEYIYNGVGQRFEEDEGMEYNRECARLIVAVAAYTGARQEEVLGLSWNDFDDKSSKLSFNKGLKTPQKGPQVIGGLKANGSRRTIKISKNITEMLIKWKAYQKNFSEKFAGVFVHNEENTIFTNTYGKFINPYNFRKRYYQKAIRAAGLPKGVNFHTLRHTFITNCLASGIPISVVTAYVGHTTPFETVSVYNHVLPNQQQIVVDYLENINLNNEVTEK